MDHTSLDDDECEKKDDSEPSLARLRKNVATCLTLFSIELGSSTTLPIMFLHYGSSYLSLLLKCSLLFHVTTAQLLPLIRFQGKLTNDLGEAIDNGKVQFWHTDQNGNYNHPDFNTNGLALVSTFQYYGTSTTDANGDFSFLTYRPGMYSGRPVTHIHCKVWVDDQDVFTSQLYFADENTNFPALLQLELEPIGDGSFSTNTTVVLDFGLGGSLPITPSQQEGPYYPVEDFFDIGNDMTMGLADLVVTAPSVSPMDSSLSPETSSPMTTTTTPPVAATPTTTNLDGIVETAGAISMHSPISLVGLTLIILGAAMFL